MGEKQSNILRRPSRQEPKKPLWLMKEAVIRIQLVNPSDFSFGIGVITPRWLYVIAAATPRGFGDPLITDETLERFNPESVHPGDVVGIGIHTANAFRGLKVGRLARERGAWVIFGGIHATLYPDEAFELGAAHAVAPGDGDGIWPSVICGYVRVKTKAPLARDVPAVVIADKFRARPQGRSRVFVAAGSPYR